MELAPHQIEALKTGAPVMLTVEQTPCILVRHDVYGRNRTLVSDDSEWAEEEVDAIAAQTFAEADSAGPIVSGASHLLSRGRART